MIPWLLELAAEHPAASLITSVAMVIGALASVLEARSMASDAKAIRAELTEPCERVARLEERSNS